MAERGVEGGLKLCMVNRAERTRENEMSRDRLSVSAESVYSVPVHEVWSESAV